MAYTLDLNKLIKDVRGPKGMAAVTEEISKLKHELERIRGNVEPKVEARLKKAQTRLSGLKKDLESRQKTWEKELQKTVTVVKKRALDAEKRLEAALRGKKAASAAKTSKKAAAPKTSKKKVSKARKTSKKA